MTRFRTLDLFSGIGGFSLGLERTGGFETVAFCEIDPFCRRVLAKHWPGVKQYEDVRALTAKTLERDGIAIDAICGGFPCQDISQAGKRAGLAGERSGLWREYARLVGELRPRYVIVENVAALLGLGFGDVLGDLAALGYDAWWDCIPASAVGAPHRRDRIWIVAHAESERRGEARQLRERSAQRPSRCGQVLADSPRDGPAQHAQPGADNSEAPRTGAALGGRSRVAMADAYSTGLSHGRQTREPPCESEAVGRMALAELERRGGAWWAEPDVGRVAHGVPARVDRLRSLGNAVVPQIPELIGRAILEAAA
jgi:DNA (cytosine-5)-methyltransferase 1